MIHIKSKKSQNNNTKTKIYIKLKTNNIQLQKLIKHLKKQITKISYNNIPIPPSPTTTTKIPTTNKTTSLNTLHHKI